MSGRGDIRFDLSDINDHKARKTLANIAKTIFLKTQGLVIYYNVTTDGLMNEDEANGWIQSGRNRKKFNINRIVGDVDEVKAVKVRIKELITDNPVEHFWVAALAAEELREMGYPAMMQIEEILTPGKNPKIITKEKADKLYDRKEMLKREKLKKYPKDRSSFNGIWVQIDDAFNIKGRTNIITKVSSWVMSNLKEAVQISKTYRKMERNLEEIEELEKLVKKEKEELEEVLEEESDFEESVSEEEVLEEEELSVGVSEEEVVEMVGKKKKIKNFEFISNDAIIVIISLSSPEDIISLCQTSRRFRRICNEKVNWKVLLDRHYKVDQADYIGWTPREIFNFLTERAIGKVDFNHIKKLLKLWINVANNIQMTTLYYPYDIYYLLYSGGTDYDMGINFLGNDVSIEDKFEPWRRIFLDIQEEFEGEILDFVGGDQEDPTFELTYENISERFSEKDIEIYARHSEISKNEYLKRLKSYPEKFVEVLNSIPFYRGENVRDKIINTSTKMLEWDAHPEQRARSRDNLSSEYILSLALTEEEADYLFDIHKRVLSGDLKITDLFLKEALDKKPVEKQIRKLVIKPPVSDDELGPNSSSLNKEEAVVVSDYTKKSIGVIIRHQDDLEEKLPDGSRKFNFPENVGNSAGWLVPKKKLSSIKKILNGLGYNVISKKRKQLPLSDIPEKFKKKKSTEKVTKAKPRRKTVKEELEKEVFEGTPKTVTSIYDGDSIIFHFQNNLRSPNVLGKWLQLQDNDMGGLSSQGWIIKRTQQAKTIGFLRQRGYTVITPSNRKLGPSKETTMEEEIDIESIKDEVEEKEPIKPIDKSSGPVARAGSCKFYQQNRNDSKDIENLRTFIHDELVGSGIVPFGGMFGIKDFNDFVLEEMLRLYDANFFDGVLIDEFAKKNWTLVPRWNTKSVSTGGWCRREKGCIMPIEVAQNVIIQTFRKGEKSHASNGLTCSDQLYCVQLTFEHELIHAIMNVLCEKPREKHGKFFTAYVLNAFGHTKNTHNLLGGDVKQMEDLDELRENVREYVRLRVENGDTIEIKSEPNEPNRKAIVISAKGTKNIQAELIDKEGRKTGRGWFSKNPISYWKVTSINGRKVPMSDKVYQEVKQVALSEALSIEEKTLLVRNKLRTFGNKGVGAKVTYKDRKQIIKGTVVSTRGPKNTKIKTGGKEYMVPYSLLVTINGANIFDKKN